MSLAPIVLFIYNRPEHTRKTLEALSKNILAEQSDLFVFADGPKENANDEQIQKLKDTRSVAHEKKWCKSVTIVEAEKNKGLAASIISGVTEIVNKYGKIIVLEDDLVTGKHFLEYMNESLCKYKDKKSVWNITGYRKPIKTNSNNSCFFYPVMDCWSWATWKDRWVYYKKDCSFYISNFTKEMIYRFNIDGTEEDMWNQVLANNDGRLNTWAIFWYATIFLQNGLCLAPVKSLVHNVGLDGTGEHCGINKFVEITDEIDWKITEYPSDLIISKKEYIKNKKYIKRIHEQDFLSILKNIIFMIIRPFYHLYKRVYDYITQKK